MKSPNVDNYKPTCIVPLKNSPYRCNFECTKMGLKF